MILSAFWPFIAWMESTTYLGIVLTVPLCTVQYNFLRTRVIAVSGHPIWQNSQQRSAPRRARLPRTDPGTDLNGWPRNLRPGTQAGEDVHAPLA